VRRADLVVSGSLIASPARRPQLTKRVNMAGVKGRVAVVKHLGRTRLFAVPTQVGGVQVVCNQEQPKADSEMSMNGACDVRLEAVDVIKKVKRTATDVTTEETGQERRDEQQQTELPQMPVFADLEIKAEDYQNDATFAPMYAYLTEHRLTGDKAN
jgi:hypothetical protein